MKEGRRVAIALVVLASLAFATSAPLARVARPAHPLAVALGRVLLAAVVLAVLDARALVASARALDGKQRRGVVVAGLLLGAHFALFQWGLDTTSLPAAVSLVSLEPLSVVLVAWAFFGIRPNGYERAGVLLATAGALLVACGAGRGEHSALGDLMVLGSVALYGCYVAIARGMRDALPARHYAALVYGTAAMALAVALPFVHSSPTSLVWPLGAKSLGCIVLLALVPTVVGHTLVQTGARFLSPSVVALVSPGETLGSIAIAMAFLGAAPSLVEALGGAIIVAGAAVALFAQRRERAPSEIERAMRNPLD